MPLKLNAAVSGYINIDVASVAGITNITFPATNGSVVVTDASNYTYANTLRLKGSETYTIYETVASTPMVLATNTGGHIALAPAGANTLIAYANGNVGIGGGITSLKFYVSGSSAGAIGTLTDGANVATNLATYNNFSLTVAGNRNLDNPTNAIPGQSGIIYITQDSTGGRAMTFASNWKFPGGLAPALSTGASIVDALVYTVRTSSSITAQLINNIG